MVRLEEHKRYTENKQIEKLPLPARVYIPLSQHLGAICTPEVKPGDYVFTGQKIAGVSAHVSSLIHASISGKVTSIQDWPHPLSGKCKAIVIEGDGLDKLPADKAIRPPEEADRLTPEQIRNVVFEAGIVGMGGAGFPTHLKLTPPKPVDTLIVNGAECEPYLTADFRLMLEETSQLLLGIELVARCLGVKEVIIAIEDNKEEAIEKFKNLLLMRDPAKCGENSKFKVKVLKSQYPQGGEKQLIKNILRKEVPRGKLPFDIGVVVQNVATCFAVYEAVYLSKPLYERRVTVTGSVLANPQNLLVRLGTPIRELINFCGPLKEELAKIIIGGPMMGVAQFTDEVPVIKTTTGVVLLTESEAKVAKEEFCIRCGACVRTCSSGLMPCLINLAAEKEMWNETKAYGALDCIECGLCNYVCPSQRRLTQSIKRAKLEAAK